MKKGYFYIFVATIMFSSFEVALKFIAGQINPVQLTLCRFFIGFLFLLPMAVRNLKKHGKTLSRRDLGTFAVLGLVGISICMPLYHLSAAYLDSSVVAVLFSCNPVFVTFLAFFLLGEPIRPRNIAALVLEVAGTLVIINPLHTALNLTGVVLILAATVLFALYGVLGKRKVAEFGGSVVTCFSFLFGSVIIFVLILITHIPAAASAITAAGLPGFADIPILKGFTLQNLPHVLFVSAGVAGIGFCAWFEAMEHEPASVVSLVYFFKPVLSPILAFLIHGEQMAPNMIAGIILIVLGSMCAILPGVLEARHAGHPA